MRRALLLMVLLSVVATVAHADEPETVAVTYRFTRANEAALRTVIQQHWATAKQLNLVTGERRFYRADGFFLEIFTWKDAAIPDAAPPEIRKLWDEMELLADKSSGKSGITFQELQPVTE